MQDRERCSHCRMGKVEWPGYVFFFLLGLGLASVW